MRTFVHSDSDGTIHSLIVVDAIEGVAAGPVPEPGLHVDEVEGVELEIDQFDSDAAREIFETHRIEPTSPSPRKLLKK